MNARDSATVEPTETTPEGVDRAAVPPDAPDESLLSKDLIFDLLRNWRRRQVLRYLDARDGTARLDELAEHIAARENGIEVGALSSSERKRVYIALYQCHLPKMDDSGVIDYNQARGTVQLREEAARLFPYLYLDPTVSEGAEGLFEAVRSALSRS